MASLEYLKEFVNERLTAAAEEIFGVFAKTILEYEEEIDRQRRLLDIAWKPEIKMHRIPSDLPHQHVCKEEEDLNDCIQEMNHGLDQEDPEPPQVKEEQGELCASQEGEQLVVEQETDTFMMTPTYEERDDQTLFFNLQKKQKKRNHKSYIHPNDEFNPTIYCNAPTDKKSLECDTCGKAFRYQSKLQRHLNIHTGEKPYSCSTCGRRFSVISVLKNHIRIHTGEKPFLCKTCGKRFCEMAVLNRHIRIHTDEKPYTCKTCGRAFRRNDDLVVHMRTHSGEKPYTCTTCGKDFRSNSNLKCHLKTHR